MSMYWVYGERRLNWFCSVLIELYRNELKHFSCASSRSFVRINVVSIRFNIDVISSFDFENFIIGLELVGVVDWGPSSRILFNDGDGPRFNVDDCPTGFNVELFRLEDWVEWFIWCARWRVRVQIIKLFS